MRVTSPLWPLRDARLPIVGRAGCRRLLSAMYDPALPRAVHAPEALRRALDAFCRPHDIEAVPRREQVLEHRARWPSTVARYRQHFHTLWAKVALDNLLFPPCSQEPGLPENELWSAMALRCTLAQLPLDASLTVEELSRTSQQREPFLDSIQGHALVL